MFKRKIDEPQEEIKTFDVEAVSRDALKEHPRNYRDHLDDQIEHIVMSLRENGYYRNIVISKDNYILAGHGVVRAATEVGMNEVPAIRLDVPHDDPRALKVLTGDNEIAHLGVVNDRMLTEILKEVKEDGDLLGTGYDEQMLAALVMVTRPASEIADLDAAKEWAGADMPEHDAGDPAVRCAVHFRNEDDRDKFLKELRVEDENILYKRGSVYSFWWPPRPRNDLASVRIEPNAEN
ncbi:MAG: ParB N-terminal domain-containing protein [Thermoplasmata archaeon]